MRVGSMEFIQNQSSSRLQGSREVRISKSISTARFELASLSGDAVNQTYLNWLANPDVNCFLEARFVEHTTQSTIDYVEGMLASPHSYLLGIFSRADGVHIGNIKLGPIDPHHSRAPIGLFIGEIEWWGKGVAKEIIEALSRWAFDELKIKKLFAGSYASNEASIRAFEACGFNREGVQMSHVSLPDGNRDDVVILGKTCHNIA